MHLCMHLCMYLCIHLCMGMNHENTYQKYGDSLPRRGVYSHPMATHPLQVAFPIVLTAAERATLERWARILLQAVAGLSNAASARALRTDRECVGRWRARFAAERLLGLQ